MEFQFLYTPQKFMTILRHWTDQEKDQILLDFELFMKIYQYKDFKSIECCLKKKDIMTENQNLTLTNLIQLFVLFCKDFEV